MGSTLPERFQSLFDARQQKHIEFCAIYASEFAHGAPGHLDMTVIARLVDALYQADARLTELAHHVQDTPENAADLELEHIKIPD